LIIKSNQSLGPSPGFRSKGVQKPQGGHIFKIQYWMYATTGGPNMKWGAQILNGEAGTTGPGAGDDPAKVPP